MRDDRAAGERIVNEAKPVFRASGGAFGGGHERVRRKRHNLPARQRAVPCRQIADRGAERARGVRLAHGEIRRVREHAAALRFVATCAAHDELARAAVSRVGETERFRESLENVRRPRMAGNFLDEHTEHDVSGVVVAPTGTGLEPGRIVCRQRDERVRRHLFAPAANPALSDVGIAWNT